MITRSPILNVMTRAADKAARGLKRDFGEVEQLQVSQKGPADFVSNADIKAEKILREELSKARPAFGFLLEEGGTVKGTDPDHRWIIDPLDGTTNFLHGLPHFAISIGLEKAGEIIAGIVYDPIKEEMFCAEKGGGAFLNDRRIRVSARKNLHESLIGTGIPFRGRGDGDRFNRQLSAMMAETAGVRRWGAAALDLAYVAAGRFDGFWEEGLAPWDIAAGLLLVKEAGGYISDLKGGQSMMGSGAILATNNLLHAPLQALLTNPA
ncbi:MAG TPA: inositol monophosphatase family protein [Dongiaceae bacterium]|nr:inositol monophosphatase family protein [Dongiaceae bacterium]